VRDPSSDALHMFILHNRLIIRFCALKHMLVFQLFFNTLLSLKLYRTCMNHSYSNGVCNSYLHLLLIDFSVQFLCFIGNDCGLNDKKIPLKKD